MADRREPRARSPRLARRLLAELVGAAARLLERLATTLREVPPEAPAVRGPAARGPAARGPAARGPAARGNGPRSAPASWLRYVRDHGVGEWESFEHAAATLADESALDASHLPTLHPEPAAASSLAALGESRAPGSPTARAAARDPRPATRYRPVRLQPLGVVEPIAPHEARGDPQPAARTPLKATPRGTDERDDRTTTPRRTSRELELDLRNSQTGSPFAVGQDRSTSNAQTAIKAGGLRQERSRLTGPQVTSAAATKDARWKPTASRLENGNADGRTPWPHSLRPEPDPPPLHEMLRVMDELRRRERLAREQRGDPWSV